MKNGKNINCLVCGKFFYIKPYQVGITKFCSRKCAYIGKRKKYCINGHEIAIVGRNKLGACNGCSRPVSLGLRQRLPAKKKLVKKQFCKHGHDTFECGRMPNGTCKKCKKIYDKKYQEEHPEKRLARGKRNYWKHRKERLAYHKVWDKEHRKELTQMHTKYVQERMKKDPVFKLSLLLRSRLRLAIKNNQKIGSAIRDLGCTVDFLKKYIESKFNNRMTWNNWGTYWELDHIIPLVTFDLTNKKQFLKAVNYKNLQPLTIKDHAKKTASETKEWRKSRTTKNKRRK